MYKFRVLLVALATLLGANGVVQTRDVPDASAHIGTSAGADCDGLNATFRDFPDGVEHVVSVHGGATPVNKTFFGTKGGIHATLEEMGVRLGEEVNYWFTWMSDGGGRYPETGSFTYDTGTCVVPVSMPNIKVHRPDCALQTGSVTISNAPDATAEATFVVNGTSHVLAPDTTKILQFNAGETVKVSSVGLEGVEVTFVAATNCTTTTVAAEPPVVVTPPITVASEPPAVVPTNPAPPTKVVFELPATE